MAQDRNMENLVRQLLGKAPMVDENLQRRHDLFYEDFAKLRPIIEEAKLFLDDQRDRRADLVIFATFANQLADLVEFEQDKAFTQFVGNFFQTPDAAVENASVTMHGVIARAIYDAFIIGFFTGRDIPGGLLDLNEDIRPEEQDD